MDFFFLFKRNYFNNSILTLIIYDSFIEYVLQVISAYNKIK